MNDPQDMNNIRQQSVPELTEEARLELRAKLMETLGIKSPKQSHHIAFTPVRAEFEYNLQALKELAGSDPKFWETNSVHIHSWIKSDAMQDDREHGMCLACSDPEVAMNAYDAIRLFVENKIENDLISYAAISFNHIILPMEDLPDFPGKQDLMGFFLDAALITFRKELERQWEKRFPQPVVDDTFIAQANGEG